MHPKSSPKAIRRALMWQNEPFSYSSKQGRVNMKVREFENLKKEIEVKVEAKKGKLSLDDFEFITSIRYRILGGSTFWYDAVLFIQRMSEYNYIAIYCQSIDGKIIQDTATIQSFYVKNNNDYRLMIAELASNSNISNAEIEITLRHL